MCDREAPEVAQVARQYANQVSFVGVGSQDEPENFEDFVERHELHHIPHIDDSDEQLWRHFRLSGQPAWVFVDGATGDGELVFGPMGADGLRERIASES